MRRRSEIERQEYDEKLSVEARSDRPRKIKTRKKERSISSSSRKRYSPTPSYKSSVLSGNVKKKTTSRILESDSELTSSHKSSLYSGKVKKKKTSTVLKSDSKPSRPRPGSLKRNSKKRNSSKHLELPTCFSSSCTKLVDSLHGFGVTIKIKQQGQFGKKFSRDLVFCNNCIPECQKCGNDLKTTQGLVENIQVLKLFYCSETCYRNAHIKANTLKGMTTDSIGGSALLELKTTAFENNFEESMRKIAPILSATLQSPTCFFCRCPFLPKDKMSMGIRKAHLDCAAAGKPVYSKTRKKPKDRPMQPRDVAGFLIYQIEQDIKQCKRVMPSKDPMDYAEKNHSIKFEVTCAGKKLRFYLFVDIEDGKIQVEKTKGYDPIHFIFKGVDKTTQKIRKGLSFKTDISQDFVVTNFGVSSDSKGLEFTQDEPVAKLNTSKEFNSTERVAFETDMYRSNAGVQIQLRLRFSYEAKSGKLRILPSTMSHKKIDGA